VQNEHAFAVPRVLPDEDIAVLRIGSASHGSVGYLSTITSESVANQDDDAADARFCEIVTTIRKSEV
jgi:hypothetical protein